MGGGSGPRQEGHLFYFNRKGKVGKGMGTGKLVGLVVRSMWSSYLTGFVFLVMQEVQSSVERVQGSQQGKGFEKSEESAVKGRKQSSVLSLELETGLQTTHKYLLFSLYSSLSLSHLLQGSWLQATSTQMITNLQLKSNLTSQLSTIYHHLHLSV